MVILTIATLLSYGYFQELYYTQIFFVQCTSDAAVLTCVDTAVNIEFHLHVLHFLIQRKRWILFFRQLFIHMDNFFQSAL
jgi:hypothetical protein